MKIFEVCKNKKQYIRLLLLADEQESMIDRYIDRGSMFALEDNGIKTICVVTDEGNGVLEIKNIATEPKYQKRGYAGKMIAFLEDTYGSRYSVLSVGTGDSPLTIPFYEKCGFQKSHVIKGFFVENYDHPIYECGKRLVDMVYLEKKLQHKAEVFQRNERIEEKS